MRLQDLYKQEIAGKMREKFGYKNILSIPKVTKVSVNVGVGRFSKDKAYIDNVVNTLTRITGQKPVLTKAKKSIAAFKVREGNIVGAVVTLRGQRMYDFLEKLINVTFPRVRDFRGISDTKVDRTGNLSVGFKDYSPFPEIKADEVENTHGLEVNIATNATKKEEGVELFRLFGFPFVKKND